MAAVKAHNGGELEAGQECVFPRAIEDSGGDKLVPLIKLGEAAFGRQIGIVLRPEVTVEVCGSVIRFAIGVVGEEREVVAEAFFKFDDAALVKSGSS